MNYALTLILDWRCKEQIFRRIQLDLPKSYVVLQSNHQEPFLSTLDARHMEDNRPYSNTSLISNFTRICVFQYSSRWTGKKGFYLPLRSLDKR